MERLTLIKIRNPFSRTDRDIVQAPYERGRSLLDIRNAEFPAVAVTVSLNGRVVSERDLGRTQPLAGDQVLFVPVIQGGGNDWARVALMIAVVAAAVYTGGLSTFATGGALAGWGAVASAGVMVMGGMLVNALLPPPKPKLDTMDSVGASQAYSWNPQTVQQPGIVIPKSYGVNRLYGNVIAAYLRSSGSKQYANALIGLGYGPVKGLRAFMLNDQPAENFRGVDVFCRMGELTQEVIGIFDDTRIEYPLSVKVDYVSDATYTTIGSVFDRIEIELTFPQGHYAADLFRGGALFAWPIDVRVEYRKQGDTDWIAVTHQTKTSTVTHVNSGGDRWSAGKWISMSLYPGRSTWVEYAAGDSNPYSHYAFQPYSGTDGSKGYWRWLPDGWSYSLVDTDYLDYITLQGSLQTLFRKVFTVDVGAPGPYEIRVSNLQANPLGNIYGDMYLSAVREIAKDDFTYPRQVLAGIRALATDQLSGSLRFSCICDGVFVRVWDGSAWSFDASANPAWVTWDILTQPVISTAKSDALLAGYDWFDGSLGLSFRVARYDGIDPSRLDLPKFLEWATWCDELVPDGSGGTEKRITFNGAFDTRSSVWEAAMQVCQTGRAVLVWNGIHLTVMIDKPSDPVQLFTVGNINIDSFKQTFLPLADRATEVVIDFANSEKNYERDKFSVFDELAEGSLLDASIELFGVTKPSEAWRAGRYRLYYNRYLTRSAVIELDLDAIVCTIGDVVLVQHDVPQWGFGGRLVDANATSVTLDREVTIEEGKAYTVMVRLGDDTLASRSVTNEPGTYTVLEVSAPFSNVPGKYDVYAFGETGKVTKPWRVMNISRSGELRFTLDLMEYNETIYGCDDEQPALPAPNYSSIDALPAAADIALDELLLARPDGGIDDVIDVTFTKPVSSYFREAEIWFNNGAGWVRAGSTLMDRFRISGIEAGSSYAVAVVTVNFLGDRMQPADAPQASITAQGKLAPPSDVQNFAAVQNGQFLNFLWDHIPDADLWGYEIREGASWETARVIASGVSANRYSWQPELNGTYRFLIKAIDTSNIYSVSAAESDVTLVDIDEHINVVLSQDEITKGGGPDGSLTNFIFDSGTPKNLYVDDPTLPAEYVTLAIDTGKVGVTTVRIVDVVDAEDAGATFGSYPDRTFGDYPNDTFGGVTSPASRAMFISWSDDNITYSAWEPYYGAVQHGFRYIKVKYRTEAMSETASYKLKNLAIMLDVPDREFTIEGFTVTAGAGDDVFFATYDHEFYAAPTVTATVIGGTVNKVPVISSKTASGFHIDLRDKTDAAVSGTVDIRVKGY